MAVRIQTLRRALEILGGRERLRTYLQAPMPSLARWLDGRAPPPAEVFLKAVDIVAHEDRLRLRADPPLPAHADAESEPSGLQCVELRFDGRAAHCPRCDFEYFEVHGEGQPVHDATALSCVYCGHRATRGELLALAGAGEES